jgi:hypothetical protein
MLGSIPMKILTIAFALLAGVSSCVAQSDSVALIPGLGPLHQTISTWSPEAQQFSIRASRWFSLSILAQFKDLEKDGFFRRGLKLAPKPNSRPTHRKCVPAT